ncbi:transcription factor bHLH68 [Cocos nucifera]|uniref:Transcription factor bHLH68 n=1 Tax=Cocos nucifera TaxID=13894 RepID=A0A8K0HY33_COCNU|nr:transcription factor bHLH68 [Cocos nucifera]
MNRGVFQSSLVQQMMGGSPGWRGMNNMRPPPEQTSPLLPSASSSSSSSVFPQYHQPSNLLPIPSWHDNQELPESWSQLLLGGLVGEEERCSLTTFQPKKIENWDDQMVYPSACAYMIDVKQESSEGGYAYGHGNGDIHASKSLLVPVSSPRSCVTTSFGSNMLDFSNSKGERRHHQSDQSSECNSTATGAAFKKARVQGPSSAQSTFKVRKEKLGDRITALHQLVSPFGKTDTASVLLEAIGYIRFLQSQIEALSSPYLGSGSGNVRQPAQGERSCIFPEDPGQLLNDNCTKKRGPPDQDANDEPKKDLRSRGLCLVPVSCTLHVGSDNGADYWAPSLGGSFR